MRRELAKALTKRFSEEMSQRFPQFKICNRDGQIVEWAWELARDLVFFVIMQPFEDCDKFTIEIAWSDELKFPLYAMVSRPVRTDLRRARLRLQMLWGEPGKREYLWAFVTNELDDVFRASIAARRTRGEKLDQRVNPRVAMVEDLLYRVEPLVQDAMQKLSEYAITLFQKVAMQRGSPWPTN